MLLLFVAIGALVVAHVAPFPFLFDTTDDTVWRMPRTEVPTVYLTFDDGPNPTATPELLDVLARHQVKATFFVINKYLTSDTVPIVRRTFDDGSLGGYSLALARADVQGADVCRQRYPGGGGETGAGDRSSGVPHLPPARRTSQHTDDQGRGGCRIPRRRLELDGVRLQLVQTAQRRRSRAASDSHCVTGRHHRHSRRAPQEIRARIDATPSRRSIG